MSTIREKFDNQVSHFHSLNPMNIERRKELLSRLYEVVQNNEKIILEALRNDLSKSEFEAVIGETEFILNEINHALKKINKWSKKKRVGSPLTQFPAKSYIQPMPLGTVLIIGPWNYPFQLLFSPLIGAIAAGNTAIIKPSEVSAHTSEVVAKMINENFDPKELLVIEGAIPETTQLLDCPFNHIFYTGNSSVGRIVMRKAAEHLCPVTLELGGKSPCLVYDVKNVDTVCDRLIWGKFFNAGQTCVAPDYILTNEELYPKLISGFKKSLEKYYGKDIQKSPDYGRIINEKHFDRLMGYFENTDISIGGEHNREERYISPTVLKTSWDAPIMQEEIFGPILPIIISSSYEEAKGYVQKGPRPLAAYLFTDNNQYKKNYSNEVISGGMCLNDTIVHLTNANLPFGGVGESGMGAYHGKYSFNIFSHMKSVMRRPLWPDLPLRYPPYKGKVGLLRWILKFFG